MLPEVCAEVELTSRLYIEAPIVEGGVLGECDEAGGQPDVEVLGPLAEHLALPPSWVTGQLLLDHLHHPGAEGPMGRHGLRVDHPVAAELLIRRVVEHPVEDAVRVPGRRLGVEVSVRRVQCEEDGGVEVLVLPDEVALHEVDHLRRVAPYGLGDRGLGEYLAAVPEPDHRAEHVPLPDSVLEERGVRHLEALQVLRESLEGDILHLVVLRRRHQDEAPRIPEGHVEELRHAVECLPRLPGLDVGDEVPLVPQEGVHVIEGLVPQPLHAEADGVTRQGLPRPCNRVL